VAESGTNKRGRSFVVRWLWINSMLSPVSTSQGPWPPASEAGLDLVAASAFVRLSGLFPSRAPVHIRETRDEVAVTDQDQDRELAVARLHLASRRRDRHVRQYADARGSPRELAAYTELHAAVEQFAAREAWLAWLDRGY
jgi:hypothetical protein